MDKKRRNYYSEKCIPQSISIDLIIDFSSPAGSMIALETALDKGIPILIGTTGFNSQQKNDITKLVKYSGLICIQYKSGMLF